ncbi:hypothetical protein EDC01DRAFT_340274 [Geopyxis carbonaria]|nr:hypothetical protein EDC01DRAFT_340274 [Geopyxis carbonaria]
MHATTILASLLFAASGLAAPAVSKNPLFPPNTDLSKFDSGAWVQSSEWHSAPELSEAAPPANARRVSSGAFICNDINFTGTCTYITPVPGNCYSYPVEEIQNDRITAFGPDPNIACQVWEHYDFSGQNAVIYYPGYNDLGVIGMNDKISSFCCWWT